MSQSYIVNLFRKLNLDDKAVNSFFNNSFLARILSSLSVLVRKIPFIKENYKTSFIAKNIDNFYFVVLAALLFSLTFAPTFLFGVLLVLLIAISVFKMLLNFEKFDISVVHVPVILFLALLAVSCAFSSLFIPSFKGLAKMIMYICGYFSVFDYLRENPKRIFTVIMLVAISASAEVLLVWKQYIAGVEPLASWQDTSNVNPENLMNRVYGTLKPYNPNLLAGYLLASVPFIAASSLLLVIKKHLKAGLMFLLFTLLGLGAIVLTGCRAGYLAILASFVFGFIVLFKSYAKNPEIKKRIIIGAVVLALIGLFVVLSNSSLMHRISSIFTFRGDSSNSYRMNVYASTFKMFLDNFWIGVGPGNTTFRLMYGLYMVTGFDALGAYNIYLEMAAESGIFAPFLFLWAVLLAFAKALKNAFLSTSLSVKIMVFTAALAIFSMLIHGLFDTIWYRPQVQILFWLSLAILSVFTKKVYTDV
ncbi:MAG: O-antigen ligase family protein [Candidatus Gastranaerophilales bacterium]|nr:O-antigen ligase family protein [Candidatus Gastranaerophilales bacterium]